MLAYVEGRFKPHFHFTDYAEFVLTNIWARAPLRALNTIDGIERALAPAQWHAKPAFLPNARGRTTCHAKAPAVKPTIERAAISCHAMGAK